MKLTFTVALVCGFVLAMALAFGGRVLNGPHLVTPAIERSPPDFGAVARRPVQTGHCPYCNRHGRRPKKCRKAASIILTLVSY
jgi:hypothetical protein